LLYVLPALGRSLYVEVIWRDGEQVDRRSLDDAFPLGRLPWYGALGVSYIALPESLLGRKSIVRIERSRVG
jgi:hypothetical protein